MTPTASWEPPTLHDIVSAAFTTHIRRQVLLTLGMCLVLGGSVMAQAGSDGGHGWLDQLTAPSFLLAMATVIYNVGMTRQQIKTLQDENAAIRKFIGETLPLTYMRNDVWNAGQRIIHPDGKA